MMRKNGQRINNKARDNIIKANCGLYNLMDRYNTSEFPFKFSQLN